MSQHGQLHALARQRRHVHDGGARARRPRLLAQHAGLEHLVDGVVQPVGVGQHDVVELAPLPVVHLPRLQRLEVEADRRDRRLELVGDGVDEAVVLLVALDLHHQEHRVDDEPGDDQAEEHHADDQRRHPAAADENPADVERHRGCDQQDAQRDEERDRLLAPGHARNSKVGRRRCGQVAGRRSRWAGGWQVGSRGRWAASTCLPAHLPTCPACPAKDQR